MKLIIQAICALGICFALNFAQAQTLSGKISGRVMDNEKKPVDGATVALITTKDSAVVKKVLANADGSFEFDNLKDGAYKVLVTYVGYKNYNSNLFSLTKQGVALPAITLIPTSKILKQVEIETQKAYIEQKIDRTVVNVGASISNTGANALEALEKVPGVVVDEKGGISYKGKSGVTILIDDRPSYLSGDDLANYLKSLPASTLDQIELMPNPPAKYDAAGNAGVINIKTKRSKAKGFNGSVAASVGMAHYWRTLESMNLNYHVDKVNLFANLGYGVLNGYRRLDVGRTYLDANNNVTSSYTETAFFNPTNYNPNLKLGMDYYVSPKTTIGFVLTGVMQTGVNPNPVYSLIKDNTGKVDSVINSNNTANTKNQNGGINFNYSHQFDSLGHALTFDLDYLKYSNKYDQTFYNNSYNGAGILGSTQNITDNLPVDINIYAGKTDYTQPLPGKAKLAFGLKSSYVNTDNAANYFDLINGAAVVNNRMTNRFIYKENINAAYANFNQDFKRFAIQAGLRAENTNVKGHQLGNTLNADSSFTQHYTSLFPTVYMIYKLDTAGVHTLNLNYGRRIDRPHYQDLNPFVTIIDKYSDWEGNPFLRPQYASNYELTYNYKSIFSLQLEYQYISDYQVEYDYQKGNIFSATTINLGGRAHLDLNASLNINPFKWWTFNFYTELNNNKYNGQLINSQLKVNSTYLYFNNNNQFIFKNGWSAELSSFYLGPASDAQFTHRYREQTNIGLQKKVLNKKGAIKLTARDIFRQNFSGGTITNIPGVLATYYNDNANRSVTIGFSYNFGSNKDDKKRRVTGSADSEAGRVGN
jgi:outer membrane receptor protein involved in Fe transport